MAGFGISSKDWKGVQSKIDDALAMVAVRLCYAQEKAKGFWQFEQPKDCLMFRMSDVAALVYRVGIFSFRTPPLVPLHEWWHSWITSSDGALRSNTLRLRLPWTRGAADPTRVGFCQNSMRTLPIQNLVLPTQHLELLIHNLVLPTPNLAAHKPSMRKVQPATHAITVNIVELTEPA